MRNSRSRRAGWLSLALLAAAVVGAGAASAQPERVTQSVNGTREDQAPARTYAAPYFAVHPDDPNIIMAASAEATSRQCRVLRSTNAGQTWTLLESVPSPPAYPWCFHTIGVSNLSALAFGSDGVLYMAFNGYGPDDGGDRDGRTSVFLGRSTDLGETWETTTVRDARAQPRVEQNRPVSGLAVDRSGPQDVVYVGWRHSVDRPPPPPRPNVAVSTDGGRTFGPPTNVLGSYRIPQEGGVSTPTIGPAIGSPDLAVARDGTVYATYLIPGRNSMMVSRSSDRGTTWEAFEASPPSGWYGPVSMDWSPEGGPEGTVHLVYEDQVGTPNAADRDVFHRRSTDGGRTFTPPTRVNDDRPDQATGVPGYQITPTVRVAPEGRVDVAWYDTRNDTGQFTTDVYYAYSEDNGQTWSANVKVNDRPIDRRIGVWSNGYDIRTPVGLAATEALAVVGWDDTRNSDISEAQDVYTSIVQHEAIAGGSGAWRIALAALVGVLIAGVVLLALSRIRARAASGNAPSPSVDSGGRADRVHDEAR